MLAAYGLVLLGTPWLVALLLVLVLKTHWQAGGCWFFSESKGRLVVAVWRHQVTPSAATQSRVPKVGFRGR